MPWDQALSLLVVACAAAYLIVRSRRGGGACGGCGTCSSGESREQNLVQIEPPRPR